MNDHDSSDGNHLSPSRRNSNLHSVRELVVRAAGNFGGQLGAQFGRAFANSLFDAAGNEDLINRVSASTNSGPTSAGAAAHPPQLHTPTHNGPAVGNNNGAQSNVPVQPSSLHHASFQREAN